MNLIKLYDSNGHYVTTFSARLIHNIAANSGKNVTKDDAISAINKAGLYTNKQVKPKKGVKNEKLLAEINQKLTKQINQSNNL